MSKKTGKTIERTYELDGEGNHFLMTPTVKAGLTRRLRGDAKKDGIEGDLGPTRVVRIEEKIGRSVKITVTATEGEVEETDEPTDDQTDDLNNPAPTE